MKKQITSAVMMLSMIAPQWQTDWTIRHLKIRIPHAGRCADAVG